MVLWPVRVSVAIVGLQAADSDCTGRRPTNTRLIIIKIPLVVILFIIAPQPSILLMSTSYYLETEHAATKFAAIMISSYTLLFMMGSSLMVLLVRDPGTVKPLEELEREQEQQQQRSDGRSREDQIGTEDEDVSLAEALLSGGPESNGAEAFSLTPVKSTGESRWCRKCWAPKPERTHHCSECNRCVLKMDHHCPWLANRCIGARTYPTFLHFLLVSTIYSTYVFVLSVPPIQFFLSMPSLVSLNVFPVSETATNQTTLESLAPMLLLQYLPDIPEEEPQPTAASSSTNEAHPPPPFSSRPPTPSSYPMYPLDEHEDDHIPSPPPYAPPPRTHRSQTFAEPYRFPSPPDSYSPLPPSGHQNNNQQPRRFQEHELNRKQRQLVRDAHRKIRIYDMGWKENLLEVIGGPDPRPGKPRPSMFRIWAERIFWGGRGRGDGHSFRHSPKAEAQLRKLAKDMVAASTQY
ncbi:zf-DHHC-domain-containing protein [Clavulina sp. PMI_390]|nr:zf-DHHC-domain-containing protein [Clavulina sp. PMI_390]